MADLISFESSREKERRKEYVRKQRERVLDEAKSEYEREERRQAEADKRGENDWMLDSVTTRIDNEEQATKKKKKKEKKSKKKKKHKESSDEAEWVEKGADEDKDEEPPKQVATSTVQRDSWMTAPLEGDEFVKTFDFAGIKTKRDADRKAKAEEDEAKSCMEKPGQHSRELNPYWRDGGLGLPDPNKPKPDVGAQGGKVKMGDCGVGWLKRALQDCHLQAKKDGVTPDSVAADKFGSLKNLEKMLHEAQEKLRERREALRTQTADKQTTLITVKDGGKQSLSRARDRRSRSRDRDRRSRSRDRDRRSRSRDRDRRSSSRDRDRSCSRDRKRRSRSRDRDRRSRSRDRDRRSRSRDRDRRSRSRDRKRRSRSRDRDRRSRSRDRNRRSRSRDRNRRSRSRDRDRRSRSRDRDRRSRSRDRDRRSRSRDRKRRSRSRDRNRRSRSRDRDRRSRSRDRDRRSRSRDRDRRSRSRDRKRRSRSRDRNRRSRSRDKPRFRRPVSPNEGRGAKSLFMKPGDDVTLSAPLFKKPRQNESSDSDDSGGGRGGRRHAMPSGRRQQTGGWRKMPAGTTKHTSAEPAGGAASVPQQHESPRRRAERPETPASSGSSDSESDSESADTDTESQSQQAPAPVVLSESEINTLAAKLVRAEIMGKTDVVVKLKAQLEDARAARAAADAAPQGSREPEKSQAEKSRGREEVLLTRTDRSGNVRPLSARGQQRQDRKRRKKDKVVSHDVTGSREAYFADDDAHSLASLVERERLSTAEDAEAMFARLAGRSLQKTDDEYQVDDALLDRAAQRPGAGAEAARHTQLATTEARRRQDALSRCRYCFDNVQKHLIVAIGRKAYVCLPWHRSLAPGHCFIVPMLHVSAGTALDEDVWAEIQEFRRALVRMYEATDDQDCVFMETALRLNKLPHMAVECVPLPRELGDMSPIYFKKAILESGPEWATNKRLVDLKGKDIRTGVPKGFPYFTVDWGMCPGFATTIENEDEFPSYFGRSVVGGMLDAEPTLWRKPAKESFSDQRAKVIAFAEEFKPFDWTQNLGKDN